MKAEGLDVDDDDDDDFDGDDDDFDEEVDPQSADSPEAQWQQSKNIHNATSASMDKLMALVGLSKYHLIFNPESGDDSPVRPHFVNQKRPVGLEIFHQTLSRSSP